ncbi:MAG: RluA family pseudouridine synthase [Saprospiraceae bacterium]|nr:RluA family pseudouridine synthase [Saprospiraceae bacterium]
MRIDKFLLERIEKVSRNFIQNTISDKGVLVNDKVVKPSYKVRPNDVIKIYSSMEPRHKIEVIPEPIDLDIRYEDKDIIIIYKPPGLVVHPGIGNLSGTLVNGLVHYLSQTDLPVLEGNEVDRPCLVHRIDKDTSGLLVVAKNDFAMNHLAKQFFDHSIDREYVALVWGSPEPEKGTIKGNIGRHPTERFKMHVFQDEEGGKPAVTHYEVLESLYYVSVIKCKLETGRTHQIRVHLSSKSHPLFNDYKYDGARIRKGTVFTRYKQFVKNCFDMIPRHALHAKSLGFIHPRTNEYVLFETDLPEDMQNVIEKWRDYVTHQKSKR